MEIKRLSEEIFVSTQITAEDLSELNKLGLKSVICNRPDGEEPGQPTYDQVSDAAGPFGIEMRYVPVTGGRITGEDIATFGKALDEMPRPVLAYCRSGARSAMLWSLVNEEAARKPAIG